MKNNQLATARLFRVIYEVHGFRLAGSIEEAIARSKDTARNNKWIVSEVVEDHPEEDRKFLPYLPRYMKEYLDGEREWEWRRYRLSLQPTAPEEEIRKEAKKPKEAEIWLECPNCGKIGWARKRVNCSACGTQMEYLSKPKKRHREMFWCPSCEKKGRQVPLRYIGPLVRRLTEESEKAYECPRCKLIQKASDLKQLKETA